MTTLVVDSKYRQTMRDSNESCNFFHYRYSGILRDKTMDDKLMYIPNDNKQITPSVD